MKDLQLHLAGGPLSSTPDGIIYYNYQNSYYTAYIIALLVCLHLKHPVINNQSNRCHLVIISPSFVSMDKDG